MKNKSVALAFLLAVMIAASSVVFASNTSRGCMCDDNTPECQAVREMEVQQCVL